MKRCWLFLGLFMPVALLGCAPQVNTFMQVAPINAPAEFRVAGLAGRLEAALKSQLAPGEVGFVPQSRLRYQERARDIRGSRAALQAALSARVFGAEYALMVAAPVFERSSFTFKRFFGLQRSVTTRVQLQVRVIDAATAELVATYRSGLHVRTRIETVTKGLPDEDDDPDLETLVRRALDDIARPLATDLAALAGYAKANEAVPVQP